MTKDDLIPMGAPRVHKAMQELREKISKWDVETIQFKNMQADVHILDDVWLFVQPEDDALAAGLRSYDGDILNMTVSSANRGASGRLLQSVAKKERLLCHKGHLGGNKTPVRMEDFLSKVEDCQLIRAKDEDLVVVANLDSPDVLSQISHFVRECARIRFDAEHEPTATGKKRTGFNPGAKDAQERRSSTTRTKHRDAATKLRDMVVQLGWSVVDRDMRVCPDLLVEKGKKIALFEVKPNGELGSFTTGIGELLVYSAELEPDIKIIAAQAPSDRSRDLVMGVLKDHGIRFCVIEKDDSILLENVKAALK